MNGIDQSNRVWKLASPIGTEFAWCWMLYVETPGTKCEVCGRTNNDDPTFLKVNWEADRDQIGDFTNATGEKMVKVAVADELLQYFHGFEKAPIEMVDGDVNTRPPSTRKTKKVRLPYTGDPLCWLRITKEVPLHTRSNVSIEFHCPVCGKTIYNRFDDSGIEFKNSIRHVPRIPGKGFFFRRRDLEDCDFFRPQHTGFNLCTNRVKQFIETKGYTNIEFLEVGDIVED